MSDGATEVIVPPITATTIMRTDNAEQLKYEEVPHTRASEFRPPSLCEAHAIDQYTMRNLYCIPTLFQREREQRQGKENQ